MKKALSFFLALVTVLGVIPMAVFPAFATESTDEKTYVIAAKVGYDEPNYFSYVFKKRYGVSPNKFRGQRG